MTIRKIAHVTGPTSLRIATVYLDSEFGEYTVKFFLSSVHQKAADYFCPDLSDAMDTANAYVLPQLKVAQ